MNYMREQGILAPYTSPEAPLLHKGFMDPKGFWSGINKRIAELVERRPHVIKYEGDPGKHIKQFNETFLGR